ncbi:carboxypeptidase-like regulatory domain-containing protein [Sediminicola sp. 1XM1-17]|uniref:carboxypeptidase-like regulatory domain-containing protein n=1 Tax=Sediminicola sp. 1XM1-17 TaxID=3127702 RepID=UPI0030771FCF
MAIKKHLIPIILIIYSFLPLRAQVISGTLLDFSTQKPIPYATIHLENNKGVISNEEGQFNLFLDRNNKSTDSLFISCMGYETLGNTIGQFKDTLVYLNPKPIALNSVIVSNKQYSADDIIALVKTNMDKNYNRELTKKRLFFREYYYQHLYRSKYSDLKSTIKAFNKSFLDSVIQTVPKVDARYMEVLCDLYGNFEKENQKIDLIKASELYDKNSALDLEALEEKFNTIIKKNVKSDSYFKIKSGLFGTKMDADELFESEVDSNDVAALNKHLEQEKKKTEERKTNFAKYRKSTISNLMEQIFFMEDSNLNFIWKPRRYHFILNGFTYLGSDPVYVIGFEPKGSEEYRGSLYINADDYAITRIDYENVKPVRNFKLLGVSLNQYGSKGKMIFYKGPENKYNLRYLEKENGSTAGIKRPLKIIEKNKHVKGRRKQNELSLDMDLGISSTNKFEIVVFDTQYSSVSQFEAFTENNTTLPTYMPKYDPEFWKGYAIIEPNKAIKEFTSKEEVTDKD